MQDTNPDIHQIFTKGALSVRRAKNYFARNHVTMTLEETINADAASRRTGINAFQQSVAEKSIWTITKSVRSALLGELLTKTRIECSEDLYKELNENLVERANTDRMNLITASHNPFSRDSSENNKLYNIATGKVAPKQIKGDMVNFRQTGETLCDEFRNGCFQNAAHFENKIASRKVNNCSKERLKERI